MPLPIHERQSGLAVSAANWIDGSGGEHRSPDFQSQQDAVQPRVAADGACAPPLNA
jgi:hypothetical protein